MDYEEKIVYAAHRLRVRRDGTIDDSEAVDLLQSLGCDHWDARNIASEAARRLVGLATEIPSRWG